MKPIGQYLITDPAAQDTTLEEKLRFYKELGFDFVCTSSRKVLETDFLPLCEKLSLPIDNVHLTGEETNALWLPGPRGDEVMERYCQEIRAMSARGIRLGVAHETWGLEKMPFTAIGLERFRRIVGCAEDCRFVIGFENSVTPDVHLRGVLDAIASPCAGFTFDTGHWNAFAPQSDFPFVYADRLVITHIQDNDGTGDQHRIPLDGNVDFARLAPVLRRAKRLTFEAGKRAKNPALYGSLTYYEHMGRIYQAARRIAEMVGEGD